MTTATLPLASPADVRRLLRWSKVIAFDLETTGLNPRKDRIRLLSLSDGNKGSALVMDCFEHDIRQVLPWLSGKTLIAHNAVFDLGFLWHAGLRDLPETICTYLLEQLLTAGDGGHGFPPCGLGACCVRRLNRELDKELQSSNWSGPLSSEQIEYSRRDARVLIPLFQAQQKALDAAGLLTTADVELRALRAFVWLAQSGAPFDQASWEGLARKAESERDRLEAELNKSAPRKGPPGLFEGVECWNWSSPQQVQEVLNLMGFKVTSTADDQLALIGGKFAETLREHRHQSQLVKMYGSNWLANATIADGRVFPNWRQIGAASGRTSADKPNVQQIPRDPGYRSCFRATEGRSLIKCDYATLQMRIAAKWAEDNALLRIFQAKGDPHTATAQALLNKKEVTRADRQVAKSANFGLLFGMTAEGLQVYARMTYGVKFTIEEAAKHRETWFKTYPGLARWHAETKRLHVKETRSASGRRRVLPVNAPDTWRLNSPVQADEADGLKLAMALLWERRKECPDACPVLAVHDELVIEVPTDQAEKAKAWVEKAMLDGMEPWLDPVPVEVEAKIVPTWGS